MTVAGLVGPARDFVLAAIALGVIAAGLAIHY